MYDRYHITCASCRLLWLFYFTTRHKSGRSDKLKSLECSKLSEMYSLGSDWSLNISGHRFISPFFHRTAYKGMKSAYFPIKRLGNSKYTILSPFWASKVLNHSTSSARRKFSGHHISYDRYAKASSGCKLSNAPTLEMLRCLDRSQTILVQKVKSDT